MASKKKNVPVGWIHSDCGSYASGSEDCGGCTINALANYLGKTFEEVRKEFNKEIKEQKEQLCRPPNEAPEPIWFRIYRRVYRAHNLVPIRFRKVVGLEEIRDTYGDCIVGTTIPWGDGSTYNGGGHCSAMKDGRLLDWFDSRMWPPDEVWVPVEKAAFHGWEIGRVEEYDHRHAADVKRIFDVPIDEYLRWAAEREKGKTRRKKNG